MDRQAVDASVPYKQIDPEIPFNRVVIRCKLLIACYIATIVLLGVTRRVRATDGMRRALCSHVAFRTPPGLWPPDPAVSDGGRPAFLVTRRVCAQVIMRCTNSDATARLRRLK